MNTMTTITAAEKTESGSYVATVLGGEKLGTKDAELGEKLLAIFAKDSEHCMCDIEYEVKADRLYLTGIEYIEAPAELGGKDPGPESETTRQTGEDSPEPAVAAAGDETSPAPDFSLESLLSVAARLDKVEDFLKAKGYTP